MRLLRELGCTPCRRFSGDSPFLTDNQHFILDCSFGPMADPAAVHQQVSAITGVMEDGFFINMANIVIAGSAGGDARVLSKPSQR